MGVEAKYLYVNSRVFVSLPMIIKILLFRIEFCYTEFIVFRHVERFRRSKLIQREYLKRLFFFKFVHGREGDEPANAWKWFPFPWKWYLFKWFLIEMIFSAMLKTSSTHPNKNLTPTNAHRKSFFLSNNSIYEEGKTWQNLICMAKSSPLSFNYRFQVEEGKAEIYTIMLK